LVGVPWDADTGPWVEALLGFAQVDADGKLAHFPRNLPEPRQPPGAIWARLESRLKKLLRLR
jgi:hypothetical protein